MGQRRSAIASSSSGVRPEISVTGLDQAHFEQIQGHYARTREPGQMFGKRCFTRMRGSLKEKNHLKKKGRND